MMSPLILSRLCELYEVNAISDIPEPLRPEAVRVAIFLLCLKLHSSYEYGLESKMFQPDFDAESNFTWIQKQELNNYPLETNPTSALFNLAYISQSEPVKVHRSGWQAVYNLLEPYNSSVCPLKLDLSIDRTFHWDCEILKRLKIIPYTGPWFGFIHHTFDTNFSDYNCNNLFKNPTFISSLPSCKALLVMSKSLGQKIKTACQQLGQIHVKVIVVYHPTEVQCVPFDYNLYNSNNYKTLVQVGKWLRNTEVFYMLNTPYNVKKEILNGSPIGSLGCSVSPSVSVSPGGPGGPCGSISCSQDNSSNKTMSKIIAKFNEKIASVKVVDHLEDYAYDDYLSDKVVFLNLEDASACNTVIECMVRGCPVIVNRLPALEEYLGSDYPLFYPNYSTQYEIDKFVEKVFTSKDIHRAHSYLRKHSLVRLLHSEFLLKLKTIAMELKTGV